MSSYRVVGKSYAIQDAPLKVTGEQIYVDDMRMPKMVHAKLILSEIASGTVLEIDTSDALKVPGVIQIFTYKEAPNVLYNDYAFYVDQDVPKDERVFSRDVRFVGDRIGAVVAETKSAAEQAAKLIKIQYEEKGPVIAFIDAEPVSQTELNVGSAFEVLNHETMVFEDCLTTSKVHHAAMETHGVIADFDRTGKLTVWSPCQSAFGLRTVLADLYQLPYHQVRVIKTVMGGSFGGKQHFLLEPVAAFLSMSLKRPVKLVLNREETILSTVTRTATHFNIRTAVDEQGLLKACSIKAITDAGAYIGNTLDLSIAMGKKAYRVYHIPNLNYKVATVMTNTPIAGGCRGWGGPQICTAIEVSLDGIARKINMDPGLFRLKNLKEPGAVDATSQVPLGNVRIKECLSEGMAIFEWQRKRSEIAEAQLAESTSRFRRGVGLACGGHVNGFFGKIHDVSAMVLKMNEDGTFVLNTGTHEQGCGTLISLAMIVAEVLDVTPNEVLVLEADTDRSPHDVGTFSSRVTYVSGKCAYNVAVKIKDMILVEAARMFNVSKSYMRSANGLVWVLGHEEQSISYRELAIRCLVKLQQPLIATETYSNVSNPGAYGAHFAEVEVDTYTGFVKIIDYLAVHDIGKIINAGMVRGQVLGCVQMGIGMALTEELKFSNKGKPMNSSFAKYTLINSTDMPPVRTHFLEYGGDDGPFGAKSIGEVAVVPVAGAIVNAVNHALNTELRELPLTPERIVEGIIAQKGAFTHDDQF